MLFGQILLNSLVLGTQVVLLVVPLYLLYSVTRIYHLALGATAAVGAYALYLVLGSGGNVVAAIALAVAAAAACGAASYLLLESFARRQESLFGLLLSFAFGITIEAALAIGFGTDGKVILPHVLPTISLGGLYLTVPGLYTMAVGAGLALLAVGAVTFTPGGRSLRSIAENSTVASSLSINSSQVRLVVFVIASLIAGFVGIMSGLNAALTPQMGFNLVVMAFIALLVGGVHSLRGAIIASYIITLIPELIIGLSPAGWQLSISLKMFLVFFIALLLLWWRPSGLVRLVQRSS